MCHVVWNLSFTATQPVVFEVGGEIVSIEKVKMMDLVLHQAQTNKV